MRPKFAASIFVIICLLSTYILTKWRSKSTIHLNTFNQNQAKEETRENIFSNLSTIRNVMWEEIFKHGQTAERHRGPADVIGIGVKKCGTGALIHFLNQHPLIRLPSKVETFFFNMKYGKGIPYYTSQMPPKSEIELAMEKTPSYFYDARSVIDRILKDVPRAKLILSLCNPVKRAFSDFVHGHFGKYKDNVSWLANEFDSSVDKFISTFSDIKRKDGTLPGDKALDIFSKGIYVPYVKEWKKHFDDSQLLILNGDDWISDPGSLIEKIEEFLGVPKLLLRQDFVRSPETGFYCYRRWWDKEFSDGNGKKGSVTVDEEGNEIFCLSPEKGRTRNGRRTMLDTTNEKLSKFFEPYNEELFETLKEDFRW